MKGANPQQLEHYVKQHSGDAAASSSSGSAKKSVGVPGYVRYCNWFKMMYINILLIGWFNWIHYT